MPNRKKRKTKTIHKEIDKEVIVAEALQQIEIDIEKNETEAIICLLETLPANVLIAFLPDTKDERYNYEDDLL